MKGCFNKCCFSIIIFGLLSAWLLLVNLKPNVLKSGFSSFVDMLQFRSKKNDKINRSTTYIKKYHPDTRTYHEPSVLEEQ